VSGASVKHQLILGNLYAHLRPFAKANDAALLFAPFDVQLFDDDQPTVLQPDLVLVCDRAKLSENRCIGVPNLVVEVLSQSTRKHDMQRKLAKYMEAGVPEIWFADPKNKNVIVVTVTDKGIPQSVTYEKDDNIPVFSTAAISVNSLFEV